MGKKTEVERVDIGIDEGMKLKWICQKCDMKMWTGFELFLVEALVGLCTW